MTSLQRESQDTAALSRALSPPPTYDESIGDLLLSPNARRGTTTEPQPPPLQASASRHNSPALLRPAQSVSPHIPQRSSPDLPLAVPPAREEISLTYQSSPIPASRPEGLLRYSFSPVGPYSMILLSPLTAPDPRPLYHISWRQDYFGPPNSVVTTVRRGATEDGTFVAEFGLGALRLRGEDEVFMWDALKLESWQGGRWIWSRNGVKHIWTSLKKQPGNLTYFSCAEQTRTPRGNELEVIAIMRPGNYKVLGNTRTSQLKIYPKGHDHLEEILLCGLMLARHHLEK